MKIKLALCALMMSSVSLHSMNCIPGFPQVALQSAYNATQYIFLGSLVAATTIGSTVVGYVSSAQEKAPEIIQEIQAPDKFEGLYEKVVELAKQYPKTGITLASLSSLYIYKKLFSNSKKQPIATQDYQTIENKIEEIIERIRQQESIKRVSKLAK